MTPNISFTMLTDSNDSAVLGVELAYCVVDCVAAILTESGDNLVL